MNKRLHAVLLSAFLLFTGAAHHALASNNYGLDSYGCFDPKLVPDDIKREIKQIELQSYLSSHTNGNAMLVFGAGNMQSAVSKYLYNPTDPFTVDRDPDVMPDIIGRLDSPDVIDQLSIAKGKFDVIYIDFIYETNKFDRGIYEAMLDLLKPGGLFILPRREMGLVPYLDGHLSRQIKGVHTDTSDRFTAELAAIFGRAELALNDRPVREGGWSRDLYRAVKR